MSMIRFFDHNADLWTDDASYVAYQASDGGEYLDAAMRSVSEVTVTSPLLETKPRVISEIAYFDGPNLRDAIAWAKVRRESGLEYNEPPLTITVKRVNRAALEEILNG